MCVKDEGEYIQEWLEYYLLQGVEHFYIYNNNGTDNTPLIIKKYIDDGIVSWIEYPGERKQKEIYNHAIANFKYETRWMGFIDCDEFIVPKQDKTVADFLHKYEKFNQILIHWVLFGSSGHIKKTAGLVIERFTYRNKEPDLSCKYIVNPRAVIFSSVHWAVVFGYTTNETGEILDKNKSKHPVANIIQINHYRVKSLEEYTLKTSKTRANSTSFEEDYFRNTEADNIPENNPYLVSCAEQIKKRINS